MTTKDDVITPEEELEQEEGVFEFVTPPTFKVEYKGDCAYEVAASIPVDNLQKQAKDLFEELQDDAELPGFRRGKAPIKLLENKFGKAIKGEAAGKLVSAAFQKLIKDEDLYPLDLPEVEGLEEVEDIPDDAPLEFTMKFEVAPKCELGEYRGLEIERPVLKVGDKQIEEAIAQMQDRFAAYEPIKANGKAKKDDHIIIDFKGTVDGETFEGSTAENYPYVLGSKRFLPEFEAALEGAKTDEDVVVKLTFPEEYGHKELAGKNAEFSIKIHEIKRKMTPKLDDEFAKTAGYESLEDMNAKVKEHLQSGADEQSRRITESNAIKKAIENSTFELPKSMLESSARIFAEQEVRRLMQMRVPPSQIEAAREEIHEHSHKVAEDSIKALVLLNEIGDTEDIEVSEEDFAKEAEAIQQRTGMDMSIVQRFLSQQGRRSEYESNIFRQKSAAVILDNAKITDKEVTQEELDEQEDEEDASTEESDA